MSTMNFDRAREERKKDGKRFKENGNSESREKERGES